MDSFDGIFLRCAVGTEDAPVSDTQTAEDGLALCGAELGIRVHGGHEDGRVLIVLRLGRDQSLEVDVDIAGEGDVVVVIDQHQLTGQVTALALVDLEVQVPKIEKADLGQRLPKLRQAVVIRGCPQGPAPWWRWVRR